MSRKTWQQLAQQQNRPTPANAAQTPKDLKQLAPKVPGLQNLLQQREALEQQMQSLGGQPNVGPAQQRWPVASARERRDEYRRWEQQREAARNPTRNDSQQRRTLSWPQQRDQQVAQATDLSLQRQLEHRRLSQRLDQRVSQARKAASSNAREPRLSEPVLRPLRDRLEQAFESPAAKPEPTTLEHFDTRWEQRQQRLLGVETGSLDALQQRSEQLVERRQQERLEARRAERQSHLLQERANERRRQRTNASNY